MYNVIGYIKGSQEYTENREAIVIGAHRDAWGYGAGDPISGTTVLLETARAFGALKEGVHFAFFAFFFEFV